MLATASTTLALAAGLAIGLASSAPALRRRWRRIPLSVDSVIVFGIEVALAIPFVLLVVSLAAVLDRVTPTALVLVMASTTVPTIAKLVRERAIAVQAQGFVAAAYALGATDFGVLRRHVAEPCVRFAFTLAPSFFAQVLVAEAALGYLGLGLAPPAATLGNLLADGQDFVADAPRLLLIPCVAVVGLVLLSATTSDALAASHAEGRDDAA